MATKNTRTSVKKVTTENRLKKKLKEDYDNFLHEEDDELPTDDSDIDSDGADDMDFDADSEGGDDITGDLGGDTDADGGGEMGLGDEDVDLTPNQEEWMDAEVDELLGGDLAADGDMGVGDDELALDEDGMGGDDFVMEDESDEFEDGSMDMGDDEDLSMEEPADELGDIDGEEHNHGIHVDQGDDVFTAEELQSIIDSPDSLYDLEDSLVQKVTNLDDDELGDEIGDLDSDIEDGGYPEHQEDEYLGEDAGDHKEPMTGLTGEDHGSFDQGYEGGKNPKMGFKVKDELMEADIMKALGWSEEKPATEGKNSKVTKDAKTGNIPAKKNLGDADFKKVSETVKESLKKSKMLIKAGSVIVKLKEAIKTLQVENHKLTKVNGILAAVGERLTKETRKKVTESFSKCKSEVEVNALYEKVVKAVKASNRPSLNEAVQGKKTQVKTVIKESSTAPKPKVKKELTEDVKRKMMLAGVPGFEDSYYRD